LQTGAADLIGAGLGASFFTHFASTGLLTGLAAGFWQLPVVGFGVTAGVVGLVGVVGVDVPPPVTTAAERLAAAMRMEAKARQDFMLIAVLYMKKAVANPKKSPSPTVGLAGPHGER
jgi:hypothetical protein